MSGVTGRGVGAAVFSEEFPPNGGSGAGTATGMEMGAVSTTTGATPPCVGVLPEGTEDGAIGATTLGAWSTTSGIVGAFGRAGFTCVAAGTWANFAGDTGYSAVAAPWGLGAASAANACFS